MCGSKWDTLTGDNNAFDDLGTSTARHGCCPANEYMSSPEGTGAFVQAESCSTCPEGQLASSAPNDDTTCQKTCQPTQVTNSDRSVAGSIAGT